jgi:hypothetical protein
MHLTRHRAFLWDSEVGALVFLVHRSVSLACLSASVIGGGSFSGGGMLALQGDSYGVPVDKRAAVGPAGTCIRQFDVDPLLPVPALSRC